MSSKCKSEYNWNGSDILFFIYRQTACQLSRGRRKKKEETPTEGVEPSTTRLKVWRSKPLSYAGPTTARALYMYIEYKVFPKNLYGTPKIKSKKQKMSADQRWDYVTARPPTAGQVFREAANFNQVNVDNLTVYSGTRTSTLFVGATAEISGSTVLRSNLSVVGPSNFSTITVNSWSILSGPVVMRSTLSVANAASVGSLYVVAGTTMVGGVQMLSGLCVDGTVSLNNNLFVSGTTELSGTLSVYADANVLSDLSVGSDLYVGGSTELVGTVSMYSDANVQLNLSVGGDVFTNSRMRTPAGYVDPEVGDLKMAVRSTERNGWLLCNGQAVNRTTYAALYAEIGTTFGSGDGVNTFNLPNAAGRILGNVGGGHSVGTAVGSDTQALVASNVPSHTHSGTTVAEGNHSHGVNDPGHAHTQTTINDDFNSSGASPPGFAADSAGSRTWSNINSSTTGITIQTNGVHSHSFTTDGGAGLTGASFSIMQPTLFVGYTFIFSGVSTSD
jgi:microcystin-dependent protein/predicted acyltransferase (DUF342 family)